MRTYGRITNPDGSLSWVQVSTDAAGYDDYVWVTTLIQCLKLNLGESPFYAIYGLPAKPSVVQQVVPDYYIFQTQKQFAPYFASLLMAKVNVQATKGKAPVPTYRVNVTTNQGVKMAMDVPA